jgi:hypothetical protein
MMTAIVILATVVISVLAVVTNTPPEAWHLMKKRIREEWEDTLEL